eukprot:996247-Amphidinium_carterae.1
MQEHSARTCQDRSEIHTHTHTHTHTLVLLLVHCCSYCWSKEKPTIIVKSQMHDCRIALVLLIMESFSTDALERCETATSLSILTLSLRTARR